MQLGNFRVRRRLLIAGDALVKRFRNLLPVSRALQVVLVRGTAHKRNLGKNGGHGCSRQHGKSGVLDAPVANVWAVRRQGGVKRTLHRCGETLRLLDFFVQSSSR